MPETGADGSGPIWGCRNRIGRPCPRSISSMRDPLTMTVDVGASAAFMQVPGISSWHRTCFSRRLIGMAGYGFGNQPAGAAAGVLLASFGKLQEGAGSGVNYHRAKQQLKWPPPMAMVGFTFALTTPY